MSFALADTCRSDSLPQSTATFHDHARFSCRPAGSSPWDTLTRCFPHRPRHLIPSRLRPRHCGGKESFFSFLFLPYRVRACMCVCESIFLVLRQPALWPARRRGPLGERQAARHLSRANLNTGSQQPCKPPRNIPYQISVRLRIGIRRIKSTSRCLLASPGEKGGPATGVDLTSRDWMGVSVLLLLPGRL